MADDKNIDNIIGSEKNLSEIIDKSDLASFLKSAVRFGISDIAVIDTAGAVLAGSLREGDGQTIKKTIYLEAEIAGHIVMTSNNMKDLEFERASGLFFDAVNIMIMSSLKRILTSEIFQETVNRSYEELVETNNELKISENKYRELANNLEIMVGERTEELKWAQAALLQHEKLASIGQLAAGVAHEINNPLGFIWSNLNTLTRYVSGLKEMILEYQAVFAKEQVTDNDKTAFQQKWKNLKLDFIFTDVDDLIKESIAGAERVRQIVSDLKDFSHVDDAEEAVVDINKEIDKTINVLTHVIPENAEIIRNYQSLPGFTCNPALICQVFLNIVLNAIQFKREGFRLAVTTSHSDDHIELSFADNGQGIPEEIMNRIFEPFFTTKDVGGGTGMGLAVAYKIIDSFGGKISVQSQTDKGTTFIVFLPLKKREEDD